ncbi:MAG: hypothetical protein L6R39_005700 [Caloplaca ligustica]|nr:MAG: hypothetical protein L6R39_005700 [Caloplaca ligustica]
MHLLTGPSILLTLSVAASRVYGAAVPDVHRNSGLTCYEDNTLRLLERFASDAAAFCPKYLKAPNQQVPSNLAVAPASRLSSACTCFEKTAAPVNPVSSPTKTPTSAPVVSSTPMSFSTIKSTPLSSLVSTLSALAPTSISSHTPTSTSSSSIGGPTSLPTNGKGYTGGKRGLVYDYNSQDFSKFFKDSNKIAFGSDWGVKRSPAPGVTFDFGAFVPTIAVDSSLKNDGWLSAVKSLIGGGSPIVFASNEPDNKDQANLTPAQAANVYKTFVQPLAGQVAIASPAVTNGGGSTGLGFLESFVGQCAGCHFDIINVHHYVQRSELSVDQAVSAVKSFLTNDVASFQAKHPQFQNTKICLGEFWLWGASDQDGADYLTKLLPWLDGNSNVACYQAFGGLWKGNFINSAGTGLSKSGQVYHDL